MGPEAWLEEVLAEEPRVAVFDCDGTLWREDAGLGFMHWSLRQELVARPAAEWLLERYRGYEAGTVDEATICGEMVQVYAGLSEHELREAAARFFEDEVEPHIFPVMEELVGELLEGEAELWAVSSTNHWVIEAGVTGRFGIPAERVLAARVRVAGGLATGDLLSVPTDEAKAAALRRAGVSAPDAGFGNSVHDLQMLQMARKPYAVNPTPALLDHARAAGWPVFFPPATPNGTGEKQQAGRIDLLRPF